MLRPKKRNHSQKKLKKRRTKNPIPKSKHVLLSGWDYKVDNDKQQLQRRFVTSSWKARLFPVRPPLLKKDAWTQPEMAGIKPEVLIYFA